MERGIYTRALETAEHLGKVIGEKPEIAIVLGSGLGTLTDALETKNELQYKEIPNFPQTTVEGHEGKLVWGKLSGKNVLMMKGRFHHYEGYEAWQLVFHIRVFKLLGIDDLLVTNAAGGINKAFKPGDLMLIKDHISFFAPSPLRGINEEQFGVRFPDMSEAYSKELVETAKKAAVMCSIDLKEGIYAFAQGPMYETPAEIRAFSMLGADAVGMSTVPEVITARHAGLKVMGISCITNMAAGVLDKPLNHNEVMETAKMAEAKFQTLVKSIIKEWRV